MDLCQEAVLNSHESAAILSQFNLSWRAALALPRGSDMLGFGVAGLGYNRRKMNMTAFRLVSLVSSVALSALLASGSSWAHDPRGKGGPSPEIIKRIAEGNKALAGLDGSDTAKGIYSRMVQWPPTYAKVRVCFMGGEDANNAKVAEIASEWTKGDAMGLRLDFGKTGKPRRCDANGQRESQIRVSYDQPGYWSVVGQASVVYLKQTEASLNLEGVGDAKLEAFDVPDVRGTILHEFGHALGFLHEHQSPVSECANEFNWDYIVKYLGGPPNNWDEDTIKVNMAPQAGDDLMMTDFDPKSIMLYYFPAEFYLKGEKSSCYIVAPNDSISETDRGTIEYMYPVDQGERESNYAQSKAQFSAIQTKAEHAGTKAVNMDFMGAFFGDKGVAANEE